MKKVLFLVMICASMQAAAQTGWAPYPTKNRHIGLMADSLLYGPVKDTMFIPQRLNEQTMRPQDSCIYIGIKTTAGGKHWEKLAYYKDLANSLTLAGLSVTNKGFETATYNSTTGVYNIPKDQRTGIYLNLGKTFTRMKPYIYGTVILGIGNSWTGGDYSDGTPWIDQLGTIFGKVVSRNVSLGGDLNNLVAQSYALGTFGGDTVTFSDCTFIPALGLSTAGQPSSGIYYNDHPNNPQTAKTYNYLYGTMKAFIANHYLDNDWFSVASLADANFRNTTAADSLLPKSATGVIGLGSFPFTKPAGKTSLVIGTYGADSTRCRQGWITVTIDGVTYFSGYFNGRNDGNKGNSLSIKAGLNYEAIVLQNIPSAAASVVVTCSGDSTRFDYIGYLKTKEAAVRPLYINNMGYESCYPYFSISRSAIDTANQLYQNAVADFIDYPVFIQNTNNWFDYTIHDNGIFHMTVAAQDSIVKAYKANLIPIGYIPTNPTPRWTARVGSTTSSATPTINTDNVDIYKLTAQAADITSMTTNLSGTPVNGDILEIQITGTAARAITWGSAFVSSTVTLPTTTITTATLTVILQYYTTSSYGNNKWVCVNYY